MTTIKAKQIKLRSLVKFHGDDNEYIITLINLDKRKVWAIRTNSLRKVEKPMIDIIKLDRKPVEIKD